jgi:hypothetical protein
MTTNAPNLIIDENNSHQSNDINLIVSSNNHHQMHPDATLISNDNCATSSGSSHNQIEVFQTKLISIDNRINECKPDDKVSVIINGANAENNTNICINLCDSVKNDLNTNQNVEQIELEMCTKQNEILSEEGKQIHIVDDFIFKLERLC